MVGIILSIIYLFGLGMIIMACIKSKDKTSWLEITGIIILLVWAIAELYTGLTEVKQDISIEALNGTLEYDTVSLDKDGKLLEIKIK